MTRARRTPAIVSTLVAAVLALAACVPDPEPAPGGATPAPTPSPSASPTPAPPEEPFDGLRSAAIDDAAALAHLVDPRTDEVWHAPAELAVAPAYFDSLADITFFDVGDRGTADILVAVNERVEFDAYSDIRGLFEVNGTNAWFITCPSARIGDPCMAVPDDLNAGVSIDGDTFYDSLTYPSAFEPQPGYRLATGQTLHNFLSWQSVLGDGNFLLPPVTDADIIYDPRASADVTTLAVYGDTDIVQLEWEAFGLPGLTNISYALRLPYGAIHLFSADDIPASQYTAIDWADGMFYTSYLEWDGTDHVIGAGSGICYPAHWTIEAAHVDLVWEVAGTAPNGVSVYTPLEGGNLAAIAIRDHLDDVSYGWDWDAGVEIPYPYANIDDFLDVNSLIAVQRPDGAWLLGLRPDANSLAYECV